MKKPLLFAYCAALGSLLAGPIRDPDLWWHIVVGRWMLAHCEVPSVDLWTVVGHGKAWRAYSWSAEVLFAWVDRIGGSSALVLFQWLLATGFVAALFLSIRTVSKSNVVGLVLSLSMAVGCRDFFTLRPQAFVWLYFVILLALAERVNRNSHTRADFLAALLLIILWANTHLTAFIGIGCGYLWLLRTTPVSKKAVVSAIALSIATVITPYGGGEWRTLFEKSAHPFLFAGIDEFHSESLTLELLVLAELVFVALRLLRDQRWRSEIWRLAGGLAVLIAGLLVKKFMPFALIYWGMLAARAFFLSSGSGQIPPGAAKDFRRAEDWLTRAAKPEWISVLLLWAGFNVYLAERSPVDLQRFPAQGVDFLQANDLPSPVLNDFNIGGYLAYRMSDRSGYLARPVTMDGRTNLIDLSTWNLYIAALNEPAAAPPLLNAFQARSVIWPRDSALGVFLIESPDWCRVYPQAADLSSTPYLIFIRRAGALPGQLAACASS